MNRKHKHNSYLAVILVVGEGSGDPDNSETFQRVPTVGYRTPATQQLQPSFYKSYANKLSKIYKCAA